MERFDKQEKTQIERYPIMKKTILTILAVACCAFIGQQAFADSVGFFGASSASGDSSKSSPTTVSFKNPWSVVASDGIFAGSNGASATMSNFTFSGDGATAVCTTCPQVQWTYTSAGTTYTFTLNSLNNAATRTGSIAASGLGTVVLTGAQTGTFGGAW